MKKTTELLIAYDTKLKQPGCVLLQAAMGGDLEAAYHFPTETLRKSDEDP